MNNKGVPPHVVESVVNHVSGIAKAGVAGTYNRALYLAERRAALNIWALHIEQLVNPDKAGAKILDIQTARK
jgi:hypothetical protein